MCGLIGTTWAPSGGWRGPQHGDKQTGWLKLHTTTRIALFLTLEQTSGDPEGDRSSGLLLPPVSQ